MQQRLGTRFHFIKWLKRVKEMTYTEYTKLPVTKKEVIQREYKGK